MARRLKVFRTPIGFDDAYVAAPSRKAALAAWGADADLFARGAAEEVTDPALTEAPLAAPGDVVRRRRGTMAEHLAALPAAKSRERRTPAPTPEPPRAPRPDRAALDTAEAALEDERSRHAAALRDIARRQAALDRERRDSEAKLRAREEAKVAAERRYRDALAAWRGG